VQKSCCVSLTISLATPLFKGTTLKQVTGNLFDCPNDEALAHWISADCCMGAGIAVLFKQIFEGVSELLKQRKAPGQCAVLLREGRFIFYLVCANSTRLNPSLEDIRSHCIRNWVHKLSMPRIGCGLDQLEWMLGFSEILEQVFMGTDITITIYSLPWTAASMN
uniref:Macro domain-containing protein n=1 Tax=Acanthochromis polyacanthus TaxID=80966 RepID=A0A3Q1FMY8_9TELE